MAGIFRITLGGDYDPADESHINTYPGASVDYNAPSTGNFRFGYIYGPGNGLAYENYDGTSTFIMATGGSTNGPAAGGLYLDASGITGSVSFVGGDWGDKLFGGSNVDFLNGMGGNDLLLGAAGDVLDGGTGSDTVTFEQRTDTILYDMNNDYALGFFGGRYLATTIYDVENVIGSRQHDEITGDNAANRIDGGWGDDVLSGGGGNDTLLGGFAGGTDRLDGGAGNDLFLQIDLDTVVGGAGSDTVSFEGSATGRTVNLGVAREQNNITIREVENLIGGSGADTFIGTGGANRLSGEGGDDVLRGGAGGDALSGGDGADALTGGADRDTLRGGAGADRFVFTEISDSGTAASRRDLIADFSQAQGDRINLSAIDADSSTGRDEAFTFVRAFSGEAGELRAVAKGGGWLVTGDIDGDKHADFSIQVDATGPLQASDFIL